MPNDNAARSTSKPDRSPEHTAGRYVERLHGHRSPADAAKRQRYLKSRAGDGDVVIGVRMKHVLELSKEFKEMPLGEIELLLESRIHYQLARSTNAWERRTAILATRYFVCQGDLDDTFGIAEELVNDDHDLVQKAVGGSLREAGKHDRGRLLGFLDDHAATMPRTVLRYAIEHLDKDQRSDYMAQRLLFGNVSAGQRHD